MGLLDHRKTWHFSVRATGEQCFQTFARAMSYPGFKLLTARWGLERSTVSAVLGESPWPACVATYQGRGGLIGLITAFSQTAQDEERRAVGSQIMFAVRPGSSDGIMACSMWLSKYSTKLAFICDARFIRSSMNDVEKQLRALDPALVVDKV